MTGLAGLTSCSTKQAQRIYTKSLDQNTIKQSSLGCRGLNKATKKTSSKYLNSKTSWYLIVGYYKCVLWQASYTNDVGRRETLGCLRLTNPNMINQSPLQCQYVNCHVCLLIPFVEYVKCKSYCTIQQEKWRILATVRSEMQSQSWPVQSFTAIKSIAIEFVHAPKLGLVSEKSNKIFGDVMGSRNSKNTWQRWSDSTSSVDPT